MVNELKIKEAAFNKVLDWLQKQGNEIEVVVRNPTGNENEIQFHAKIYPVSKRDKNQPERPFLNILFVRHLTDSFLLRVVITLPEVYQKSIDATKDTGFQQGIFINLFKLVLPLGVDCATEFPDIKLTKLIFIDSLKDKQYFFDAVSAMNNAMLLVGASLDEISYSRGNRAE